MFPLSSYAYHPFNTDDPGTTDYRSFELETAGYFVFPEDELEESSGYVAIKAGLARKLEFDAGVNYIYWLKVPDDDDINGWGIHFVCSNIGFSGMVMSHLILQWKGLQPFPQERRRRD